MTLLFIPPPPCTRFFNRSENGELHGCLCPAYVPSVVTSSSELLVVREEKQALLRHGSWSSPGKPVYLQRESGQLAPTLAHL